MFKSSGIIHYDKSDGDRVIVNVDQSLGDYYYSLIPSYYRVVKPRWKSHITVVSPFDVANTEINWDKWRNQEGKLANFVYNPSVVNDNGYWYLDLWSLEMESIRLELGLSIKSRISIPPEGYTKCFHITLGKDWNFYELHMS